MVDKTYLAVLTLTLVSACEPSGSGDERASDGGAAKAEVELPTTDYDAAEAIAERGRECGVISEGHWSWSFVPGQFCSTLCLLRASCAELERSICKLREVASIEDCLSECDERADVDEDVTQCGDGTTIPSEGLCDLVPDCPTGEDERHCERFRCGDGQNISTWRRCDGLDDCEDGSDEAGCALLCGEPRVDVQD